MNYKLLDLLATILGDYILLKNGTEAYFRSPFNKKSFKKKLAINVDKEGNRFGQWHCWQTPNEGYNIVQLFNRKEVSVTKKHYDLLKSILGVTNISSFGTFSENKSDKPKQVVLPEGFRSFTDVKKTIPYNRALNYIRRRKISYDDIIRYNIGYCLDGKYKNRIIIPSYDADNNLNFFLARSFETGAVLQYKNPDVSEDVIIFENQINWNYPLTIIEGAFDGIAVRKNATPILGKYIPDVLKEKIYSKDVKEINIAMDEDAIDTTLEFAKEFMDEGIIVKVIDIPKDEDPSSLGFVKINKIIIDSEGLDLHHLMLRKLS